MTRPRKKILARSFRRQVLVFVAVTVLAFAAVSYFAFSKTVIVVTPRIQTETVEIPVTVGPAPAEATGADAKPDEPQVTGRLMTAEIEVTETFSGLSEQRDEPTNAGGRVTITNNWSRSQPLAAGTRLLSESGVLFRTTERVDVPAGGTVETAVLADEPGRAGEIAPSRFEIVALWEGLKSQIYAESAEAFTGGTKTVSRVTQEDLNKARKDTLAVYNRKAAATLSAELAKAASVTSEDVLGVLPLIAKESATANIGDEVPTFTYTLNGTAIGVLADNAAFATTIRAIGEQRVAADQRLLDLEEDPAARRVTATDAEKDSAVITASAQIDSVIRLSSAIFSRSALVQKDRQDLVSHFAQFDEVEKTEVHFSPFWVFRAPALPDHIEIRLAEPVEKEAAVTQ